MRFAVVSGGLLLAVSGVCGAEIIDASSQYKAYLTQAQSIQPVADFGEQVSLRDGKLGFRNVDFSLPGNGPAIQLVRTAQLDDGLLMHTTSGNMLGEWQLEIPRLQTVVAVPEPYQRAHPVDPASPSGWQVPGVDENARCSGFAAPATVSYPGTMIEYRPEQWWFGYQLVDASGNTQDVFDRSPELVGSQHTIGTRDNWVLDCLPQTANGVPGEAFLAIAPDGTKYWFDYMVYSGYDGLGLPFQVSTSQTLTYTLPRQAAALLVTRIEDRFGNYVTYSYNGSQLTGITASDGRQVTLVHGSNTTTITTGSGSTAHSWTYQVDTSISARPHLSDVVLPDGSAWAYGGDFFADHFSTYEFIGCSQDYLDEPTGTRQVTVTAPAGATATFTVQRRLFGRSDVPRRCSEGPSVQNPDAGFALSPMLWIGNALTTRQVTGPGLAPRTWTYSYSAHNASWSDACGSGCATAVWTQVTNPAGERTRSTFSNRWDQTENKLLREETFAPGGALLRTVDYSYATAPGGGSNPYPWPLYLSGFTASNTNEEASLRWTPQSGRVISQQGASFSRTVTAFDAFARPLSVSQSSSIGGSRSEVTTYEDNLGLWVLGQVATRTVNGIPVEATTFDAFAQPITITVFGQLRQTLGYDYGADPAAIGMLSSVTDGNGQTTWLTDWKRGIPQMITFPGTPTTTRGALVDDAGQITAVTDENGYITGYGYDAMGRLASIVYPTGDSVAWNNTISSFVPVTTAEYGIPAGHWRQTVTTGNAVNQTYFDALWRPVLTREFDAADLAGTERFTAMSYDAAGRADYSAYPMHAAPGMSDGFWITGGDPAPLTASASMMQPMACYPMPDCYDPKDPPDPDPEPAAGSTLPGVHTFFDALGRAYSVQQDSQLGPLTTTTQYLTGFKTQVTNPRGHSTTTSYLAWDAPSTEYPTAIVQPEGAYTDIARDPFGKPLSITRHDAGSSQSLMRYFVYDGYQQLCKTVEPESLATVMTHDAAGNLAWSASGQNLISGAGCDVDAVPAGAWVKRGYDARNRLTTLDFSDIDGGQVWTYTPDGLPEHVTTWNDGGASTVVNAYSYNRRRLLTVESQTQTNGQTTWFYGYGYTPNGQLASIGYPNLTVTYSPNALGQPTQVVGQPTVGAPETYATGISYHPNGALAGFTYGNGIVHTLTRNARGLPEESRDAYGSTSFLDDIYDYDPNGNVAAITDGATGRAQRGNRTMAYDGLDRLTDVTSPMYGSTGAHYSYDVLDNLTHVIAPGRDHWYCHDASNRLTNLKTGSCSGATVTGLGYDTHGNLTNKNGTLYAFDLGNRLRDAGAEHYRYDAYGRRTLSASPAGELFTMYSRDGQLLWIRDERDSQRRQFIYLRGSLLAQRKRPIGDDTPALLYQHTDALGSPVAVTDQNRTVLQRSEYEPYGFLLNRPINPTVNYASHLTDRDTGLSYMQQRYYDPLLGTFLSTDAISVDGTTGWNFCRYCYAANNPYKFTDPDGRVIHATTLGQQNFIAEQINRVSLGTFGFDKAGNLQLQNESGDDSKYSSKYQGRLVEAINSDKTIDITVSPTYQTKTGQELDVDGPQTNGGLTDGKVGGNQSVVISGQANTTVQGASGSSIPTGPDMVLMHELVGHAIPNMIGGGSGNAVENENQIREQIPGAGQRESQEWHREKF